MRSIRPAADGTQLGLPERPCSHPEKRLLAIPAALLAPELAEAWLCPCGEAVIRLSTPDRNG